MSQWNFGRWECRDLAEYFKRQYQQEWCSRPVNDAGHVVPCRELEGHPGKCDPGSGSLVAHLRRAECDRAGCTANAKWRHP